MSCVLRVFYFARSFSCRRKFHFTSSLFLEFSSFLMHCAVVICCMRCKLAQINSNSHAKLSVSSPMRLSNSPDTRCNIARNIARNIRHSTWLHGRNISCYITRNIWSAVTKLSCDDVYITQSKMASLINIRSVNCTLVKPNINISNRIRKNVPPTFRLGSDEARIQA